MSLYIDKIPDWVTTCVGVVAVGAAFWRSGRWVRVAADGAARI